MDAAEADAKDFVQDLIQTAPQLREEKIDDYVAQKSKELKGSVQKDYTMAKKQTLLTLNLMTMEFDIKMKLNKDLQPLPFMNIMKCMMGGNKMSKIFSRESGH